MLGRLRGRGRVGRAEAGQQPPRIALRPPLVEGRRAADARKGGGGVCAKVFYEQHFQARPCTELFLRENTCVMKIAHIIRADKARLMLRP